MSSFDKVVKLACKPKPAPPKAKYLDPIVAATWSEDGAVHDVCKALVPRLREPNAIVVFKALIVLHTMIRNGATDNVLSHLSSSEVLRLRNVSAGNWDGYNAPQNMQHYALYLDSRIRAYRELQHDAIRVQAETNRDMRLNNSIEEDMAYMTAPPPKASSTKSKAPQRSKTIMGRKLRVMTVEKGLLRETKTVQKMIDSLVECRFYLDDLEDELTITALRMLVKDLLILFQAGNEGVINVLEHYFEMSKFDAEEALGIYRNFCGQTERVVEYLGVAKKLQNLLNVPIPNLKHAPVSLASSLQEYLNDPNFEQNRIEYQASKTTADKNLKRRNGTSSPQVPKDTPAISMNSRATETSVKPPSPPPAANSKSNVNHVTSDFFSSIEEEQTPNLSPIVNSATGNYLQQQTAYNPFVQRQMTGVFTSQPFVGQVQIPSPGFTPSSPVQSAHAFQSSQPLSQTNIFTAYSQPTPQHRPFSTFVPQQSTGHQSALAAGSLQPQPTGANPFRQSVAIPQATGVPAFNSGGIVPVLPLSALQINSLSQMQLQSLRQPVPPSTQFGQNNPPSDVPVRPASTPLTAITSNSSNMSPPKAQPVRPQQTGSRNPFGVPVTPVPPIPKPPTLLELSMGIGHPDIDGSQPLLQSQSIATTGLQKQSSTATTVSTFSNVASSFAFMNKLEGNDSSPSSVLQPLNAPDPLFSNPMVSSHVSSGSLTSSIKSQPTGFAGVKPFKPTSNFGASLLDSLPPIPQSSSTTPDASTQTYTQHALTSSLPMSLALDDLSTPSVVQDGNAPGIMNSQPTSVPLHSLRVNGGFTPGVGLRPQATGALGAANPFRATMFATTASPPGMSHAFVSSASTPLFGGLRNGTGSFSASTNGNSGFSPSTHLGQDTLSVHKNAGASLI